MIHGDTEAQRKAEVNGMINRDKGDAVVKGQMLDLFVLVLRFYPFHPINSFKKMFWFCY